MDPVLVAHLAFVIVAIPAVGAAVPCLREQPTGAARAFDLKPGVQQAGSAVDVAGFGLLLGELAVELTGCRRGVLFGGPPFAEKGPELSEGLRHHLIPGNLPLEEVAVCLAGRREPAATVELAELVVDADERLSTSLSSSCEPPGSAPLVSRPRVVNN